MQPSDQNIAQIAHRAWDTPPGTTARLINVSENHTYLLEADGFRAVLRLCRPGYQSRAALQSELDWIEAVRRAGTLQTPAILRGRDGHRIQCIAAPSPQNMVLFAFAEGATPSPELDLIPQFQSLGGLAAALHLQARDWQRPNGFTRLTWGVADVFGPHAHWGNWRDAPNVGTTEVTVLEEAQVEVSRRLSAFGTSPDRFGLIHADMRLANLLVCGDQITVIDFDDCGFGWFLYDFAAAISFMEDDPIVPELRKAWLAGYREKRDLPQAEADLIPSLIMLRRFALLAWIGTHIEAPEPQALAPDFACRSAALAERYLSGAF